MFFRTLALTGLTLAGTLAPLPATARPAADLDAPLLLADGHDDRTITVLVSDGASVPADRIEAKYSFRNQYFGDDAILPTVGEVEAAVLPALAQAGVSASAVTVAQVSDGDFSYHDIMVTVTLPPSHTAIGNATDAIETAADGLVNVTPSMDGIRMGIDGCDVLEATARREILSIATERAEILVAEMGGTLGEILTIHDSYQSLNPFSAAHCLEPSGDLPPVPMGNYYGAWTTYLPTAPLEIELSTTLEVTFAVE